MANVSTSTLRYEAAAWVTALGTQRNCAKLRKIQRLMAMRVASAYRTISSDAVCVIAGMILICIALEEDTACYMQRSTRGIRKTIRAETMTSGTSRRMADGPIG